MGTWGAGNFDDDLALDWLGSEFIDPLTETIRAELGDHDEVNGSSIMAAVEVLAVLCEQLDAPPPTPIEVAQWRASYLREWNGYIDALDPKPGFKEARLQTIGRTFERLAVAAQKYWSDKTA